MDIFEYLPQLIVAYDGNDEFANLIHVKKANKDNNYVCPCCGGIVKPRALDSTKEQSHYYHVTGKCTKESQLHFFCKNWLFEKNSKFYIDGNSFEVDSVEIEKAFDTPFGKYKPDVTVHTTSGQTIYFEMFFTNRKTGDDYFCKWDYLGNAVVEVNIKEYMSKTEETTIPEFKYLYHDGICYSKLYEKRDLYANTIAKIKHELTRQKVLDYKARIEQLDWFWQMIRDNSSKDDILDIVANMTYDDMVTCYSIIKRKQCVSYLKNNVLELINKKVISEIREELGLSYDKNVYFDMQHIKGRTYDAGIRLDLKTKHITYNQLFPCLRSVFSKNMLNKEEIVISDNDIRKIKESFDICVKEKDKLLKFEKDLVSFEGNTYQVRMNNDLYTVLILSEEKHELLFENMFIRMNINDLSEKIQSTIAEKRATSFFKQLMSSEQYKNFLARCKEYKDIDVSCSIEQDEYDKSILKFKMYICGQTVFNEKLECNMDDFIEKKEICYEKIENFFNNYSTVIYYINKINNSKNNFWKASFSFGSRYLEIKVDQKIFIPHKYITFSKIYLDLGSELNEQELIDSLETALRTVMKNMERCGYRLLEVANEK